MTTDPGQPNLGATPRAECTIPILRVRSLKASITWYVAVLGFRQDWYGDGVASVSHDGHPIMLCEGAQGAPGTWLWLGVSDARQWYELAVAHGARIRMELVNLPWALEFHVEDPDGHVLRVGSRRLANEPLAAWPEGEG